MQKLIISGILIVSLLGSIYILRLNNKLAQAEIAALTIEVEKEKESVLALQNSMAKQQSLLHTYNEIVVDTRAKYNDAVSILEKHDLEYLSYSKPNLIEPRVNKATEELFNEIEQQTTK